MTTYRNDLSTAHRALTQQVRSEKETNAGLWLDKYIVEQHRDNNDSRRNLMKEVSALPIPTIYKTFYERWKKMVTDCGAKTREAKVKGRMIVGLGSESVTETSISLHRTYGVPYIPGSALKGLAANYAHQGRLGEKWTKESTAYKVVFGDTDEAGYITFFDALYIPGTGHKAGKVLYPDIITVHHQKYYQGGTGEAPTDSDNPIPVPFLSATGTYLIALAAPDLPKNSEWIPSTFTILEHALKDLGIGAKTSSGYGRMELLPVPVDPEIKQVEDSKRELDTMRGADVAGRINGYYQAWLKLTSQEAKGILAEAIIQTVRRAGRERQSADKAWYKELQAFLSV